MKELSIIAPAILKKLKGRETRTRRRRTQCDGCRRFGPELAAAGLRFIRGIKRCLCTECAGKVGSEL